MSRQDRKVLARLMGQKMDAEQRRDWKTVRRLEREIEEERKAMRERPAEERYRRRRFN